MGELELRLSRKAENALRALSTMLSTVKVGPIMCARGPANRMRGPITGSRGPDEHADAWFDHMNM